LSVLACDEHKTRLIDIQKQTGKRLSWYRKKLNRFDFDSGIIEVSNGSIHPEVLQFSKYIESLITQGVACAPHPVILQGLELRESLTLINFLAHFHAILNGRYFKPTSIENNELVPHYLNVWQMLNQWPDSFYLMLSQYIDHPMSNRGVAGLNKHYRDLYERLHRQQENQGVARIKDEFDRYIEAYWPGVLESGRISRIKLSSPIRNIISKREAEKIIGCRPERIDKLVQMERLSLVFFKGKAHYLRNEVEAIMAEILANWSTTEACEALEITPYQLKKLLDSGIIVTIQKPDKLNRDWIIDKAHCVALVAGLRKGSRKGPVRGKAVSLAGIQRQGFSVVKLISAMQEGYLEYGVSTDTKHPDSLKQFIEFDLNDTE